ncbi:MAG: ATP-binding protein [Bacteroidia bacterium]
MSYLSRELHDHVGHTLLNMQLIIENRKLDNPEEYKNLMPFESLLNEAGDQLRQLSRSLNQEYLSRLSFQEAINKEMERLSEFSTMEVKYIPGTVKYGSLDRDQLLMSYRIFQEIINNIIRHSQASSFTVRSNNQDYLLKVEDNGKGFHTEQILASGKASGLRNIMKRAALAGLELDIQSAEGRGTTITLSMPKTIQNEQ